MLRELHEGLQLLQGQAAALEEQMEAAAAVASSEHGFSSTHDESPSVASADALTW